MNKKTKKNGSKFSIKHIRKEDVESSMSVKLCLAGFYGLELGKETDWSVDNRYRMQSQALMMIEAGLSKLFIAFNEEKLPIGMVIVTKTEVPKIKRIDSIVVFEPFRKHGVGRALIDHVRGDSDLHSFSVPGAVEWHLKNGFKNLGLKEDDGTYEMFTGRYKPKYTFDYVLPMMTAEDQRAIDALARLEPPSLTHKNA